MNTKHTAGPFRMITLGQFGHSDSYRVTNNEMAFDVQSKQSAEWLLSAVQSYVANARLIAAAPRLLAAMERLASEYAILEATAREMADNLDESGCDHVSFCGANTDALGEARAALESAGIGESRDCVN